MSYDPSFGAAHLLDDELQIVLIVLDPPAQADEPAVRDAR